DGVEASACAEERYLLAIEIDHPRRALGDVVGGRDLHPRLNVFFGLSWLSDLWPTQRSERLVQREADAAIERRILQGIHAGLRLSQLLHQVEKVGGFVRLEGDHEFLVVQPE